MGSQPRATLAGTRQLASSEDWRPQPITGNSSVQDSNQPLSLDLRTDLQRRGSALSLTCSCPLHAEIQLLLQ